MGKEGENKGEKHHCAREASIGCLSHAPNPGMCLTGNRTGSLSVCRLALNPLSHTSQCYFKIHFLKDFVYLFLECGEGREKVRERNINVWLSLTCPPPGSWPTTQACALTGN